MVTKRTLGAFILIAGIGAIAAIFLLGRLGAGEWGGIGPLEIAFLLASFCFAMLGVPLLKGKNDPAVAEEEPSYTLIPLSKPQSSRLLSALLWTIVVAALIGYLVIYFVYAIDLFKWPYDYDQGESFELYDAYLHSQGLWPYRDSSTFPFYSSNYPPLFHLFNVLLFPLFGPTLLSGRILSFTFTLFFCIQSSISLKSNLTEYPAFI